MFIAKPLTVAGVEFKSQSEFCRALGYGFSSNLVYLKSRFKSLENLACDRLVCKPENLPTILRAVRDVMRASHDTQRKFIKSVSEVKRNRDAVLSYCRVLDSTAAMRTRQHALKASAQIYGLSEDALAKAVKKFLEGDINKGSVLPKC